MAKIKGTAAVANIRGSTGDLTFQLWRPGINILRSKPTNIHNPQSMRQQLVRIAMSFASATWYSFLTELQRDAWHTYALLQRRKATGDHGTLAIIRGNTGEGRGYHYFASLTVAHMMSFVPPAPSFDPPLAEIPPLNNTGYAVNYTGAPDDDVDISWTESAQHEVGARTRIWLWNPTRIYHKQLLDSPLVTTLADNFVGARSANGDTVLFSTLAVGAPLWFQMDVINPSGQVSPPSQTFKIVNLV